MKFVANGHVAITGARLTELIEAPNARKAAQIGQNWAHENDLTYDGIETEEEHAARVKPQSSPVRRYAIVTGARGTSEVGAYLPLCYRVEGEVEVDLYGGTQAVTHMVKAVVISGEDKAGWTLDDYVIPRLGSGSMSCSEIDLSHPAMKQIEVAS